MKASAVINSYKNGRRDFSGETLRGENFAGKNLSSANFSKCEIRGANFSNCDIRGTNFKDANLTGANFSQVKASITNKGFFCFIASIILFIGLSQHFAFYTFNSTLELLNNKEWLESIFLVLFILLPFIYLYIAKLENNLSLAIGVLSASIAISFVITHNIEILYITLLLLLSFSWIAIGTALGFAIALNKYIVFSIPIISLCVLGYHSSINIKIILGTIILTILGSYTGYHGIQEKPEYSWIRYIALPLSNMWGGTSFFNANLTEVNFTNSILRNTNFSKANTTRTNWKQCQEIEYSFSVFGNSFLHNRHIRELLVTRNGNKKNYQNDDLRGVNLEGANLIEANLEKADLNEANLHKADLSKARLVQTKLDNTDLTGATLTGATIQNWNITSNTNLQGIKCKYVFMKQTTEENDNPRRKPDNWDDNFNDENGDFATFIQPLVNTLDLYHNQRIDPRAIAIAFKQLAEEHPDAELQIVAIEKRGNDNVLIRVATSPEANHSELNKDYFTNYNKIQAKLKQHGDRIKVLENQVQELQTGNKSPSIEDITTSISTIIQYNQHNNYNLNIDMSKNIDQSQNTNLRDINANQSTVNLGEISGQVSNNIQQLPDNAEDGKANIKDILKELQTAIETEENLKAVQKFEALEALETLTQAAKNPEDSKLKKLARLSKNALLGITSNIPHATKFIQACNELLPAIAKLLKL